MARAFAKPFYDSKEWKAVREYVMMRDHYCCRKCGKPAQEVHHIIHLNELNIWDPGITLNPDNLMSLCRECHFRQHELDAGRNDDCGDEFEFDESGQLVKIK